MHTSPRPYNWFHIVILVLVWLVPLISSFFVDNRNKNMQRSLRRSLITGRIPRRFEGLQRIGVRSMICTSSLNAIPSKSFNPIVHGSIARKFSSENHNVLPTYVSNPELKSVRSTTGLILALAVQRIYKDSLCAGIVCTENGFYVDFYLPSDKFSSSQLGAISKEMEGIIKKKTQISCEQSSDSIQTVANIMGVTGEKKAVIKLGSDSIYLDGDVASVTALSSTGEVTKGAWELESVSATHWRGDDTKPMLQRIYGTAWLHGSELETFKQQQEQARARDHRLIGQQLDLFSIQEDAGGGLVFWHPKGGVVRRIIEDYWKQEHIKGGYEMLFTPHIANLDLWKTSGHCDFYKQDMFQPITVDTEEYQLKPMNCPFHCLVYKNVPRSFRDLPIRWAELGTVYRYERSGALHGLFRVRGFTQDDAHIFCLPEQLEDEIVGVLDLVEKVLQKFGFKNIEVMLSTRPKESVGSDEIWTAATNALVSALNRKGKGWGEGYYTTDEGGGAFYGPKIDIKIRDSLGRLWQCSTIQCDFNLPERFQLEYTNSSSLKERPIMVHRAIFGSIERFFGVLIENTAGSFPLWLAPVQVRILPISNINEAVMDKCNVLVQKLKDMGIRAEVDNSHERMPKMIRNSEIQKIPVVVVVGQNEVNTGNLSVRVRKHGAVANPVDESHFLSALTSGVKDCVDDGELAKLLTK